MQGARQRCFRIRRGGAVFRVLAAVEFLRVFAPDLDAEALARVDLFPPDTARRLAALVVFLTDLLAALVVFLPAFFAADLADRAPVMGARLATLVARLAALVPRLATLLARFAVLAALTVRLTALFTRLDAALDDARVDRYVIVKRIWSPTAW